MTVRVPAESFEHFFTGVESVATVTRKSQNVVDISYEYYDTAGRLKTQESEKVKFNKKSMHKKVLFVPQGDKEKFEKRPS